MIWNMQDVARLYSGLANIRDTKNEAVSVRGGLSNRLRILLPAFRYAKIWQEV